MEIIEYTEGNIRVTQTPFITINDKPLQACGNAAIEQAFLRLLRKIEDQRKQIEALRHED